MTHEQPVDRPATVLPTTVLRGGRIFTSDAAGSVVSAVALRGGRIVAVGGDRDVAPFVAEASDVVDLGGRMVVPGFVDAHAHPVQGGLERIRADLTQGDGLGDYLRIVADYAASHPDATWVRGGGWDMGALPGGLPHRRDLDAVVPDRPVVLPNRDHHSLWVNSRALELAGVDDRTPDPADGRIERDADGVATGLLHEGAAGLVERLVPQDTDEDLAAAIDAALAYLHSVGVVAWQDAWTTTGPGGIHEAYLAADAAGALTAHVSAALWWDRSTGPDDVDAHVAQLAALRDATPSGGRYRVPTVKVMQDGVIETFTAAVIEPYLDRCGHPTGGEGISFLDAALVREVTARLGAAGFDVHFHALGDRAVREVLDAIEHAHAVHGTGPRHQLAHLQLVAPDDVARFRRLGAVANLQALWASHEPQMDELTIPVIGAERAARQYPFGDLHRAGVMLAMGSDWPVSSPSPIAAIHTAVNRVEPDAPAGTPPLGADQALDLAVALRAYTAGSAWAAHLDDVTGTIRVGSSADVVVLDRDPFDGPAEAIGETQVVRTYAAGRLVHQA